MNCWGHIVNINKLFFSCHIFIVIIGPTVSKKGRISTSNTGVSENDLFVTNLLAAFKDFELHLSLLSRTVAEASPSWSDIEKSILSQRESSFGKNSSKLASSKELSLDDVACIAYVAPELYALSYHCDVATATVTTTTVNEAIDPSNFIPNKLFIQTVDTFDSSSSSTSVSSSVVEAGAKRNVSSTLERRKDHFRYDC